MFEMSKESQRVHAGKKAVQIGVRDGTFTGGVLQVVDGVEPGQTYRFSAWGHVLYSPDPAGVVSSGPDPLMKIGIDTAAHVRTMLFDDRSGQKDDGAILRRLFNLLPCHIHHSLVEYGIAF